MASSNNDMLELGRKQADMFVSDSVAYCEVLVTCSCPRQILLMAYGQLVRQRKLVSIEEMLLEQKELAWQTAKDFAKGRLGRRALVEVVKALLVIEYFLNL